MKARPTIFLSGVSHELGSFRDAVETEIQKKGCFPENQPSFPPDYRTVEEMLRRKLHDADAVVHIVGFRFGAEPNQRPVDASRRSYTQMEFDIARTMETPVYVFLSTGTSVRDDPKQEEKPEDAEAVALQFAHREAVQKTNHLYYFFKDKADLCNLVAQIPPVQTAGFQADISRIIKFAPAELIGRDDELKVLNESWLKVRRAESSRPRVLTFVALGGEGKTSLVAKWAAELAHQDWPGCDAAFAWSFYNQGTHDPMAASSDLFLTEALMFFGDAKMAGSAQSAFDKGRRLAQLVGERRSLLILDGLEPLQYAPTSPMPGELKDQGIAALLKGLAATSQSLCIVTTRYSISDLKNFWQTTALEIHLTRLAKEAGVALLRLLGVRGTEQEFDKLVEDVNGHALTLNLLGTYLRDAHAGDIRKRDLVKLEEADAEEQGGHAFRVMDAYAQSFEIGGKNGEEDEKGQRALALMRLLGLFDRPVNANCLEALCNAPAIPNLTEAFFTMEKKWLGLKRDYHPIGAGQLNVVFTRLGAAKLLTVNRDSAGTLLSLDAHPLLREYFARQLRTRNKEAWRTAHRRLYEHLCATTPEKPQPTLEDLQSLYQAVAHGCHAGMQQQVFNEVYVRRIQRGNDAYSTSMLGAVGADLEAVASFFEQPWNNVSSALREADQAWLLTQAGQSLRASGRLTEALGPMRAGLVLVVKEENWKQAAICAGNLSELELTLGEVAKAVEDAQQSVTYAHRSGNWEVRMTKRASQADAHHQAGQRAEALACFRDAEKTQAECQAYYPLLYSVQGFWYCDLLLAAPERAAWQCVLGSKGFTPASVNLLGTTTQSPMGPLTIFTCDDATTATSAARATRATEIQSCSAVYERATQTLLWVEGKLGLLAAALDRLSLGRAELYAAILEGSSLDTCQTPIQSAVDGLLLGNTQHMIPRGLLTRALLCSLTGARTGSTSSLQAGPESAQSDLDDAWEIAERGPMPLYMADIHLHRARLFFREANYPWESLQKDLAEARRLIEKHGYWRRKDELEDAELAILGKPVQ